MRTRKFLGIGGGFAGGCGERAGVVIVGVDGECFAGDGEVVRVDGRGGAGVATFGCWGGETGGRVGIGVYREEGARFEILKARALGGVKDLRGRVACAG